MANYAPEKGIGFVRCLIVMGGLSLASGVVVSWLSPYFGYAQSYGLMDSPGFATFLAVGMSIAPIIATLSLIFRNNAEH